MAKEPGKKNKLSLRGARDALHGLGLSSVMLIVATTVALIAVGSFAWMSENRNLGADGTHADMKGENYSISFLTTSDPPDGLYETVRQKITGYDSSALVWKMTDDNNINNIENQENQDSDDDFGVYPGASGMISFYVTPKTSSVKLDCSFELCAYVAKNASGEIIQYITDYQAISSLDRVTNDTAKLLNGHIMLFRSRQEVTDNGKTVFKYADPILPDANGIRTISNLTAGTANTPTQVDIYWVWPITLSTIVNVTSNPEIRTQPFFSDSDSYTAALKNVCDFPDYYLKGISRPADDSQRLTEAAIAHNYYLYGDCYDRADNDIGTSLKFMLIKMSVSESETTGGTGE